MNSESVAVAADNRDARQFMAGWMGLLVCGLVSAIIWFFAIRTLTTTGEFETSALECTSSYGVSQETPCITP